MYQSTQKLSFGRKILDSLYRNRSLDIFIYKKVIWSFFGGSSYAAPKNCVRHIN